MPAQPDGISRNSRRLMLAGGFLLIVLATAVVLLPLLLRAPLLPSPRPAETTRPPPETASDEYVAAQPGEPEPAPEAPPEMTNPAEAGGESEEPIVEQRRVPEGASPSDATSEPGAVEAGRSDEWDRSGQARQRGVEVFGGTVHTENAVEAGLAWLAAHQSPDGIWDRMHFDRQCPEDDRCSGIPIKRETDDLTAGVTGLSLLAFLGAGYTDRNGPYQDAVRIGVDALLKLQEPHGGFSRTDSMAGYNDALATLALAEYLALTGEARVRPALERAVARLVGNQQSLGGWDYLPTPNSGRNDTSITAWVVQALHSCAAAGIEVPHRTLVRAALFLTQAAERDGRVRYSDSGSGFRLDENLRPVYRYGPGMIAAGLTCEQMLGWRLESAMPLAQRGRLLADLPSAAKARGRDPTQLHGEYYWYYGTLAMFQRGGDDWQRWNARLRDAILPLQNRDKTPEGVKRHAFGSWPPFGTNWGVFGRMAGRVYTTAISVLTLEIYYRHTPAFLAEDVQFTADDWRAYLERILPRERLPAVACLSQLRVEVAEPVLVGLLSDSERRIALAAAEALAWIDSPVGVPLIEQVVSTMPPWEREALERALARGKAVAALPPVEGRVRVYSAATNLATVELPRSYVGLKLEVFRGGAIVAHLRVIQRFTGHNVVVAALDPDSMAAPEAGDRVVGK
jgi:hypothetical protein